MAKPPLHRPAPRATQGTFGAHQALRNPWLDGPGAHPGHGPGHGPGPGPGSHSSGSTTYDGYIPVNDQYAPEPPQLWRQHHSIDPSAPVYEVPDGGGEEPQVVCTLPHRATLHRTDRPMTPGGLSQMSGNVAGTATGCGGCGDALDTWCYYCVQGVLGIAALAGLSLLIASAVLKGQPPRAAASANLSAMPYIGAMLAIVAGALLLVQWFARNEKKRRKRRLQHLRDQRAAGGGGTLRRPACNATDLIPLQELHKFSAGPAGPQMQQTNIPMAPPPGHLAHQFQPLLGRPVIGQQQHSRPQDIMLSPSGTPWWRRQQAHPGRVVYPS